MTELYDALEDCLELMANGASIEHALKRHPELAPQLRSLLEASEMARQAGQILVPPEARRRGRSALLEHVREGGQVRSPRRMIPLFPRAALTGFLAVVLVLTSTGLVSASSTSLPGQQLYPVKRGWESVRLFFTFNLQERDLMESGYEQERLDETSELLGQRIAAPITFSGLLSTQAGDHWTISGIPVAVGAGTVLPAAPVSDGAPVTVTGITRPDGVVEARQIQVMQPGVSLPPLEPSEQREQNDGEHENQQQGAAPTMPALQPPAATQAANPGPTEQHTTFQFSGVVQSNQGTQWTINGQPVYVDSAQIDAQVTVGSLVRFQGYYSADWRFIVTTIALQNSDSGSKQDKHDDSNDGGETKDGGTDH